jgi:hypothetical protein
MLSARFRWLQLIFILPLSLAAATPANADVNPPTQLIPDIERSAKKPEVVIYYANETAPDERELRNYSTITSWLKSSGTPQALKVADQLARDLNEFHLAVDQEVQSLTSSKNVDGNPVAIAIFTNRIIRNKQFILKTKESPKSTSRTFETPNFSSYILTSNPLSDAASFKLALDKVVQLYDPNKFEFVLITKSHGVGDLALTPRLAVRAEESSPEELLKLVGDDNTGTENLPAWAKHRLGIQKTELMSILEDEGKRNGMFFRMVFLESCHSEFDTTTTTAHSVSMPHNVATIVTTHGETPYRTVDYEVLLNSSSGTFSARIEKELSELAQTQRAASASSTRPMSAPIKRGIYFIPLALLSMYFFITQLRARQQSS